MNEGMLPAANGAIVTFPAQYRDFIFKKSLQSTKKYSFNTLIEVYFQHYIYICRCVGYNSPMKVGTPGAKQLFDQRINILFSDC